MVPKYRSKVSPIPACVQLIVRLVGRPVAPLLGLRPPGAASTGLMLRNAAFVAVSAKRGSGAVKEAVADELIGA